MRKASIAIPTIFVLVLVFPGCGGPTQPSFQGGIRFVTKANQLGRTIAVINVQTSGTLQTDLGPGTGSLTSFTGFTDNLGIFDEPNAKTNAIWGITVNYTTSPFPCGISTATVTVPTDGAIINRTCQL